MRHEVPVVRVRVFDSCDQRAVVDGGERAGARDVGVDEFEDNRGWRGEVGIGDDLEEGEKRWLRGCFAVVAVEGEVFGVGEFVEECGEVG